MDLIPWAGVVSGLFAVLVAGISWWTSRQKNEATAISELTDSIATLNKERRTDRIHFDKEMKEMRLKYSAEIKALTTRVSDLEKENNRLLL